MDECKPLLVGFGLVDNAIMIMAGECLEIHLGRAILVELG